MSLAPIAQAQAAWGYHLVLLSAWRIFQRKPDPFNVNGASGRPEAPVTWMAFRFQIWFFRLMGGLQLLVAAYVALIGGHTVIWASFVGIAIVWLAFGVRDAAALKRQMSALGAAEAEYQRVLDRFETSMRT